MVRRSFAVLLVLSGCVLLAQSRLLADDPTHELKLKRGKVWALSKKVATGRGQLDPVIVTDQSLSADFDEPAPEPESLYAQAGSRRQPFAGARDVFASLKGGGIRSRHRTIDLKFPATVKLIGSSGKGAERAKRSPKASSRSVSVTLNCSFQIYDDNGGLWDWTYDARILNPSGGQLRQAGNFASNKPGYSSALGVTLTDPAEGTYTCKIKWWVQTSYLGEPQATVQLSYLVPTTETTMTNGWSQNIPTYYNFRALLIGASFTGRKVHEDAGSNEVDTCWFNGSTYPQYTGLRQSEWTVESNNTYGDDTVGWHWQPVDYYRQQNRAPCQWEITQQMEINRPGGNWAWYKTNRLKAGFTNTTVWAERDGEYASKSYQ